MFAGCAAMLRPSYCGSPHEPGGAHAGPANIAGVQFTPWKPASMVKRGECRAAMQIGIFCHIFLSL